MSQSTAKLFKAFDLPALRQFVASENDLPRHHGRLQAMHQRAADAARKEIQRRKRGTP